ncbi:hypothetical protein L3X38_020571 [Prunus dulcis]|uniref:Uncharacterized protein n=1 Tax=Prunus dulcis TaxID=3755 RepID=A0AAD4WFT5_PRUDU|nr:hypothetical protein L3X38_020571 [Prunus dulcis]
MSEAEIREGELPAEAEIPEEELPAEAEIPEGELPAEAEIPEGELPAETEIPEGELPAETLRTTLREQGPDEAKAERSSWIRESTFKRSKTFWMRAWVVFAHSGMSAADFVVLNGPGIGRIAFKRGKFHLLEWLS